MDLARPIDLEEAEGVPVRARDGAGEAVWWRRLLTHRLVQFGLVAGALFAIAPGARAPSRIELERQGLDELHGAAAVKAGRIVLSGEDAKAVERRAIEDEILYREGLRLGLDENDGVVRNRVIQKTLFLAEELSDASRSATDAELRAYFEAHASELEKPSRVRFQHVFAHAADALPARPADDQGTLGHPLALGEPSPIPAEMIGDERALIDAFGPEAGRAVLGLPEGKWEGPIASPFGVHYVKVIGRDGARAARFEDVRPRVIERLSLERRERAVADFLSKAFTRYQVSVDGQRIGAFDPPRRVAMRSVTSGED